MMNCIFCKIVNNEIPSYKIYEDDLIMAFLDINPDSAGHTLIIPKSHTLDINSISDELLSHIIIKSKDIATLVTSKLGSDGFTLVQNNGCAQGVKHFHLHIIPNYEKKYEMDILDVYKKITKN